VTTFANGPVFWIGLAGLALAPDLASAAMSAVVLSGSPLNVTPCPRRGLWPG
jgi:hypothetical protein